MPSQSSLSVAHAQVTTVAEPLPELTDDDAPTQPRMVPLGVEWREQERQRASAILAACPVHQCSELVAELNRGEHNEARTSFRVDQVTRRIHPTAAWRDADGQAHVVSAMPSDTVDGAAEGLLEELESCLWRAKRDAVRGAR